MIYYGCENSELLEKPQYESMMHYQQDDGFGNPVEAELYQDVQVYNFVLEDLH